MSFESIYTVNFVNDSMEPSINVHNWPQMQIATSNSDNPSQFFGEMGGLNMRISRQPKSAQSKEVLGSVYLSLPGALSMHSRIILRVKFDLPRAGGYMMNHVRGGQPRRNNKKQDHGSSVTAEHFVSDDVLVEDTGEGILEPPYTVPEPWAVAVMVGSKGNLFDPNTTARVSCQFHRSGGNSGIRINDSGIPTSPNNYLESPLDYPEYQQKYNLPKHSNHKSYPHLQQMVHNYGQPLDYNHGFNLDDNLGQFGNDVLPLPWPPQIPLPEFILEQSFSGWNSATTGFSVGNGTLTIRRGVNAIQDQRMCLYQSFSGQDHDDPHAGIKSLGVNLGTVNGVGWMSIRLKSFEVLLDTYQPDIEPLLER